MSRFVAWFDEVGRGDAAVVGGKGANLGELARAGLPVPPGFVVTADAYLRSMDAAGVRAQLRATFDEASRNPGDPGALAASADRLRALVHGAEVAEDVWDRVLEAYRRLGDDVPVAVRSSATAEDAAGTSFAGMHETYVNVVGAEALLQRLVDCWASLYGARVISYRASQGLTEEPAIAVVVQQLVASERAGVLFTADPSTGDRSRIIVEGAFGLGEVVVGGEVEPDTYVLDKEGPRLVTVRVGHKDHQLLAAPDGTVARVELDGDAAQRRVLTDDEVLGLARLGKQVEEHYGTPQDMEWSYADGRMYLVQTRPITTLTSGQDSSTAPGGPSAADDATAPTGAPGRTLLRGLAASSGTATGPVRVLASPEQGDQLLEGEVLVAPLTNPDWVPTLRRAVAIVTDGGGMTCHAAIVARELGVPCVVGARTATTTLRDGEVVTVDGRAGVVTEGTVAASTSLAVPARASAPAAPAPVQPLATRIYVNLAMADRAEQVAQQPVDGVGLLRAEFLVTDALGGVHPPRCWSGASRASSSSGCRSRCCGSRGHSHRARSSTGPSTSARTSSAASRAASVSSPSSTTR